MKISGYAIERIHKNMYRIINADGQQVGIIERNKQASIRPGTGRWHWALARTRNLKDYQLQGTHRTGQQPSRNTHHLH